MKTPLLVLGILLLALLLAPAGHGAHHRHHYPKSSRPAHAPRLLPLRVVRTPAVARQHREVRAVPQLDSMH